MDDPITLPGPPRIQTDLADAHTSRPTLAGRKAIITGGTTGIGRAIAVLLAAGGAEVFICGRDPQHLRDGLNRIREVGTGDGVSLDLTERGAPERFVEAARQRMGDFDIAILNAAIAGGGVRDMTLDELYYMIGINFTACLATAHLAAGVLGDRGDIVFIGSNSAHELGGGESVYGGIKAGISGFARALRKELGPQGVRVSLIEPGTTGSDMQYESFDSEQQAAEINAERMLRAEDIAVACQYVLTQPWRTVIQQLTVVPRIPRN